MSNLPLQIQAYKAQVLRLKELLERLRERCLSAFKATPTIHEFATRFEIDWSVARRFWQEKKSGGPDAIRKISSKLSESGMGEEILNLLENTPDNYKSMVVYPKEAILMAFDVFEAYRQMTSVREVTAAQFASLFSANPAAEDLVRKLALRSSGALESYQPELDSFIREVIYETDWTTAVPPVSEPKTKRDDVLTRQVREICQELRPHFQSDSAFADALPAHLSSLRKAQEGTIAERIQQEILKKAKTLKVRLKSTQTQVTEKPQVPVQTTSVGTESYHLTSAFITSMNAVIRMVEAAGVRPDAFTDGQRDNLIRIMVKIMTLARIDSEAINRILKTEGLSADDPALQKVFSAISGVNR